MNIGDALAGGVAAVGGTMEKIGLDGVRSAIEESRQARLLEMQSEIRLRDEQTGFDRKVARAPEENRMAAESATSRAEADLAFKEGSQGRTQAMAASDSAAKLGIEEGERERRQGLINANKTDALAWEKDNAGDVNALARDKARATHIDDGAGLRAIQTQVAQLALDRAKLEAKIPVAVSKSFDAAKQQYHDLLTISSKDGFDPTSETGKRVLADQLATSKRMESLLAPYMPEGAGAKEVPKDRPPLADALGVKPAAAKPSGTDKGVAATSTPAVGKDFYVLEREARALDGQIEQVTKRMNSPQGSAPGSKERLQSEIVGLAKKRNEVEQQINALRAK